ncbi:peptidoglycan-binding protein [Streptomyces griseoaurantiacus]|uniref:Peptidoglycan-binding protein n=1 Tax=Streptomyces griseoaurantiacus TaxID=68213 RepID=A0A7W2DXE0_9ACTN|nr:peptidoglycan-binding protein [Streptomyces griseoaurantiacus]MBA5224805.1 peptidoglycan-binding protein [Streptomyces griseoaurantiacus]
MSRWKPLPTELEPTARQLVIRLRRLKDRTGLSLARLAERTGYSAKSWERYLGGRSLPPPEAVRALARLTGTDPVPLLALHEVAAASRPAPAGRRPKRAGAPSGRVPPQAAGSGPEDGRREAGVPRLRVWMGAGTDAPPDPRGRDRAPSGALRVALVASAVAAVLALSAAALLAVRLRGGDIGPAAAPPAPVTAAATAPDRPYGCHLHRVHGHWYAGNSRTRHTEVVYGSTGPEVAEAQCLLRRAGISPGGIDGIFGPLTRRAVRAMQQRSGLAVDGRVGPHTWKALRG